MSPNPVPPVAPRRPHTLESHGHSRFDDYYWLRERENADVLSYLEAENAYTREVMAHTVELQETLYQEMVGRIQETDSSAPVRRGDYYYYTRTEAGKQYTIHCRKQGSLEAPEEILLDENELAAGHNYFKLGVFRLSPNQQLLAYSTDTSGGERYTLFVKELATGRLLPDRLENSFYSAEWASDNRTLFYTVQDEAWRSYKLFRHTLGEPQPADAEIFHEGDELFSIWLGKTRDEAYLVLTCHSMETTECHVLRADMPQGRLSLVEGRRRGHRYFVDHRQGQFVILSNDGAPNNRLMETPVETPAQEGWQTLIPHDSDRLIETFELFDDFMAIVGRSQALPTLEIHDFSSGESHAVRFPEPVYATRGAENWEPDTHLFRFVYTSMTTADTTVDYDVNRRAWTVVKQELVPGGYDPDRYETARIWATNEDGVEIPLSLLYRKGLELDGSRPCLLYGYGSYGASQSPGFDQKRLSLVDRGFIWAIAHVRGGQEMGRHWYENGKFLHKKNTFSDFIACARHLIAEKYTSPQRLAAMGRSAGGLLMGAVTTMAPELFQAVVAAVPFVDVVTTMLDASLPLTAGEWEEWGNPQDETFYRYMLSYSPYDNTGPRAYPHILITAGLNDPRVQYWEPAKWAARLRSVKTDENRLLLKTHMGAGHFSSSGRYNFLRDIAFEYAFLLDTVGVG